MVREYYGKGPIAELAARLFERLRRRGPAPGGVADLGERLDRAYRALGLVDPADTVADQLVGRPSPPEPEPDTERLTGAGSGAPGAIGDRDAGRTDAIGR